MIKYYTSYFSLFTCPLLENYFETVIKLIDVVEILMKTLSKPTLMDQF